MYNFLKSNTMNYSIIIIYKKKFYILHEFVFYYNNHGAINLSTKQMEFYSDNDSFLYDI